MFDGFIPVSVNGFLQSCGAESGGQSGMEAERTDHQPVAATHRLGKLWKNLHLMMSQLLNVRVEGR